MDEGGIKVSTRRILVDIRQILVSCFIAQFLQSMFELSRFNTRIYTIIYNLQTCAAFKLVGIKTFSLFSKVIGNIVGVLLYRRQISFTCQKQPSFLREIIQKLLFRITSVKILIITLELTLRIKIGGGFESVTGVLFCFSAEFILSNNAKRLFFKRSVQLLFLGVSFSFFYINIPQYT